VSCSLWLASRCSCLLWMSEAEAVDGMVFRLGEGGCGNVETCNVLRLKIRKILREWPSSGESVRANSLYAEGG